MTRSPLALPPSLLAIQPDAVRARLSGSSRQRRAKAHGDTWEAWLEAQHREAISRGLVVRLDHYGPATKCVGRGEWVSVGKGPPDYLGCTSDGRMLAIEAKHLDKGQLYLDPPASGKIDRSTIPAHQAAYLDSVAMAGGVAVLVVEIEGVCAAIPWSRVPWARGRGGRRSIGRDDLWPWEWRTRDCYPMWFATTEAK